MSMIDLAKRLRSLANFDPIPVDACIDLNEAAVQLIRLEREVRNLERRLYGYTTECPEGPFTRRIARRSGDSDNRHH